MTIRAGLYARISLDWEGMGLGVERQLQDCRPIAVLVKVTLLPQPNSARTFHPEKVVAEWRDQPAPEREPV